MNKILFIFLCLLCTSFRLSPEVTNRTLLNKFSDPVMREIIDLKNDRKTFLLLPYLYHINASYREEAAMAFASLQDTVILNYLLPLLNDPDVSVRKATAFAVGQIGDNKLEGNLLNAFYSEQNAENKAIILTAMGKCANERILIFFNMLNPKDSIIRAGLARGIYYAGLKNLTSEALLKKAVKMLSTYNDEETKLAIAHYLSRTKNLNLTPFEGEITSALAAESKASIRMPLALALGKTGSNEAIKVLNKFSVADPDYRVRVNAIKALENMDKAFVSPENFKALYDKNVNVAVASSELIKHKARKEDLPEILTHLEKVENWRVFALLSTAVLKNSTNALLEEKIWNRYKKSKNLYEKGFLLKALAFNSKNMKEVSNEMFQTKEAVLKTYGIEALAEVSELTNDDNLKKEFYNIFKKAIESGDVALVGTAAAALRNKENNLHGFIDNPTYLFQARDQLKLPQEIEAHQELQKTIDFVTNTTTKVAPVITSYKPVDWSLITSLSNFQKVLVKSSKGDFVVELMVEEAPATVANFLELSKNNFFNGKKFHRVVPNFVVQGGGPRGDGWGSTDEMIRSEFNYQNFKEGYIGMASAGKDTESCQWFIMHSDAPHLDGRYTNFARVTSGMSVIHQLEIGDYIKSIENIR